MKSFVKTMGYALFGVVLLPFLVLDGLAALGKLAYKSAKDGVDKQ